MNSFNYARERVCVTSRMEHGGEDEKDEKGIKNNNHHPKVSRVSEEEWGVVCEGNYFISSS